jgi:dTDP-4-amino-4,6-dideoxygalactose transaminase
VVTDDSELRTKVQVLRDHGQATKHLHSTIGWNARMDGIQAAVLSVKLRRLAASNAARRARAQLYDELLADEPLVIRPFARPECTHVYHIYAVRVPNRDAVMEKMAARGVRCGIHYPVPIHLQKAYSFLGLKAGSFPVAERCAQEFLSLPMYPEIHQDQVEFVVNTLKESLHS